MKQRLYLPIVFLLLWIACREDESRGFPEISTSPDPVITDESVLVSAEVSSHEGVQIIDYGVVFIQEDLASGDDYNRISLGSFPGGNWFSVSIDRNMQKGKTYIAKPYVQTADFLVYGNPVSFVSMGSKTPVIKDFNPKVAFTGDTVKITGEYFASRKAENKVWFGMVKTEPFFASDTVLKVIVPELKGSVNTPLVVEVAGKTAGFTEKFSLGLPLIKRFTPAMAFLRDRVKVSGKGFSQVSQIKIDTNIQDFNIISDTVLVFTVSDFVNGGMRGIQLKQLDREVVADQKIEIIYPEITSVSPEIAWIDTILTIRGTNLDRLSDFTIDNSSPQLISATGSVVKLKVNGIFDLGVVKAGYYQKKLTAETRISLNPPAITSVGSANATYGDKVELTGDRFFAQLSSSLGKFEYIDKNRATLTLDKWSLAAGSYAIPLFYNRQYPLSPVKVTIPGIEITRVSPYEIKRGSEIKITATNLPSTFNWEYMNCYLGEAYLEVKDFSNGTITAVLPEYSYCPEYPELKFTVGAQLIALPGKLHVTEKWEKVTSSGLSGTTVLIESAGNVYACSYTPGEPSGMTIRLFNNDTEEWTLAGKVSESLFYYHTASFSVGPDLYLSGSDHYNGVYENRLYRYSLSDNTATQIANCPQILTESGFQFSFVIGGKAYVGNLNGFYGYDPASNRWTAKAGLPTAWYRIQNPLFFSAGGKGYLAFFTQSQGSWDDIREYNEFWEYDPSTDSWTDLVSIPLSMYGGGSGALYTGKVYLAAKSYRSGDKFGEFDPVTRQFREMTNAPGSYGTGPFLFINGSYLYFTQDAGSMWKIPLNELQNIYK
ncbi:MAG: IPT/TIG domain-containing protein [Prolixibacteraceae bacterium]